MIDRLTHFIVLIAMGTMIGTAAFAHTKADVGGSDFDEATALQISQGAIGRDVGDHRLLDVAGEPRHLDEFHGRPLVISLIYTSCSHTCPVLTQNLAGVVKVAQEALGEDSFNVVSIGFDAPVDTPERMRVYAHEQGIQSPNWVFLSADAKTIELLTNDLGFIFFPSPKGFDHIAQTTVLDAEGRVYRQVYGENFSTPALVEPLKELVFGNRADGNILSNWINGVRLFCTIYDPASGRYRFDYSLFITIGVGLISLGSVLVFVLRAWRQSSPPGAV
ncbi:MAG: SCO family protein [Gammaproteobacteria bacterium]